MCYLNVNLVLLNQDSSISHFVCLTCTLASAVVVGGIFICRSILYIFKKNLGKKRLFYCVPIREQKDLKEELKHYRFPPILNVFKTVLTLCWVVLSSDTYLPSGFSIVLLKSASPPPSCCHLPS